MVSAENCESIRVLVACENGGVVRDCFDALGCDAWSCDLLESARPGKHVKSDAVEVVFSQKWDLVIAHPPCTFLTVANNRNWARFDAEQKEAVRLALVLWSAPVPFVCLENPTGFLNTGWMPPAQIVQPWQFGQRVMNRTCLWLKNLSPLRPTTDLRRADLAKMARRRRDPMAYVAAGPNRWKVRSKTFPGIAEAMARQWTEQILVTRQRVGTINAAA